MYSNFFKSLNKRVKIFYLGAIGQLILCRNIENAKEIKSIFIIALSETNGNLQDGNPTHCDQEQAKLIKLNTNNAKIENLDTDYDNNTVIEGINEAENFNPFENL